MQKTQAVFIQLIQYEIENIVPYRTPLNNGQYFQSHIELTACKKHRLFSSS